MSACKLRDFRHYSQGCDGTAACTQLGVTAIVINGLFFVSVYRGRTDKNIHTMKSSGV